MAVTVAGVWVGAAAAAVVAYASVRFRALTPGGAVAAWVVGTVVFGVGGVPFTVPMLAFFVSSSALSRIRSERKRRASSAYAKTGARDAWQVLANGALPTALVVACAVTAPSAQPTTRDWYLMYLCSIALATADTWATEIGSLVSPTPRLITTFRSAHAGTSGAVSLPGTAAAVAGAAFIPLVAFVAWPRGSVELLWRLDIAEALAVAWAGVVACLLDSVLGATVQAQWRCRRCGRIVETPAHCGAEAGRVRGLAWLGNDAVNLISSAAAAAAGWYLLMTFAWPTG
jgi:uncharacterized protein (TIGR00297 family)